VIAALAVAAVLVSPVTRPVQAVDGSGGQKFWAPSAVPAQLGDTIEWRLRQPGNEANEGQHDIWIVPPGGAPAQLGVSYANPTVTKVVDQLGTYAFYCSIHGGLGSGGMNGTITVGADDPGPPVDPGTPWTAPDPGGGDTGPPAASNPSVAPTVFELGDIVPPRVSLVSVAGVRRGARVRVRVSEAGTVTVRLLRGAKVLATKRVRVKASATTAATVKLPARTHLKTTTRLRVQVSAKDASDLESGSHSARVWVGD
jgi:plastocyanin